MKKLIFLLIFPVFAWGQGAQLPKYKVSTLPTASLYPTYTVQVTDGLTAIDCTSGGGTFNVLCTSHGGAWNSVAQASGTTTNALTANSSGGASPGDTFNGSAAKTWDYHTFGAQQALTLTTAGTSGPSTLSGGALNIPQYSNGSGVQFNPSTATLAFGGSSTNEDDQHVTSSAIAISTWSCNGTTCTFNTTGTNPLTTTDWVDVSSVGSWFAWPAGYDPKDTGIGTFQVLSPTTNSFQIAYTTNTGSGTGGNAYSASYFVPYWASRMPYLNGHGQIVWRFGTCAQDAVQANFNFRYGGFSGTPKLFFFQGCQNDIAGGATATQVEGYLQAIWANAHALGYTVFQSPMLPTSIGLSIPSGYYNTSMAVTYWMYKQPCNYFTTNSQCYDHWISLDRAAIVMQNEATIPGNSATGGYYVAEAINQAVANQNAGNVNGMLPFIYPFGGGTGGLNTNGVVFWQGADFPNLWYWYNTDLSTHIVFDGNGKKDYFYNALQFANYPASSGTQCLMTDTSGNVSVSACPGSTPAFSTLTGGTNTTAAMLVGSGASLGPTGTGTIQATNIANTVTASSPITMTGSGTTASPYTFACPTCGTSTGTVSDGAGTTTANQLALSTTTAHVITYSTAIPNGTTATTQSANDNSTKVATTAYVDGKTRQWSCQPGLGDGLNAIAAGTYLQSTCMNTTGSTVTLTGLKCFTDNAGTSTMNASGNTLGALLTGAVTCTTSFAAGTQSANVALTNGDYIKFTFVADGASKQTTWVVTGTY